MFIYIALFADPAKEFMIMSMPLSRTTIINIYLAG